MENDIDFSRLELAAPPMYDIRGKIAKVENALMVGVLTEMPAEEVKQRLIDLIKAGWAPITLSESLGVELLVATALQESLDGLLGPQ